MALDADKFIITDGAVSGTDQAMQSSALGPSDVLAVASNLSDVASASSARGNLGVDAAGTDNSTDVTLGGTGTYISIAGQVITVDPITESDISDLGSYITGITGENLSDLSDVTITSIATGEVLKWNGSAWINQTLAEAGISAVGHTHTKSEITDLSAYEVGGTDVPITDGGTGASTAAGARTNLDVDQAGTDNSTDVTLGGTGTYISIAGQVITVDPITESDISDLGAYITGITGENLSDLSDVTITSIATGEVLKWNGSAWINNTLAEAGIAAASHNHAASEITSGSMADARIAESNVTQHEAAIDHGTIAGLADDDHTQYSLISSGAGAPSSTPSREGLIYVDTTADTAWVSAGTASSADWKQATGAGGGDLLAANNLSDLASAATSRTNLGVDAAGTDNSTDVTLGGTGTYISIAGQVITVDPITESDISDLGAYITGITGEPLSDLSDVTITSIATGEVLKWNGSAWINNTLAEAGIAAASHNHAASEITSGTFADALIAESNVTQHEAAIDHGSIAGLADDDHTQYSLIASGAGAPGTTPSRVGLIYIDTTGDNAYVSTGTASSADWDQATGMGGGDLLAANNLSDVASAATARTNLGLAIGSDVQAHDAVLDATTASFTTADETKLDGIETAATADQSDAEIRTAVEAATDSNVFTDADHSKLDAISGTNTGDEAAASLTVQGIVELATVAETDTGTDATRAVTPAGLAGSALQSKVDGIETAATADQTDAEIRAAVEAASDSNVFTDADHTKLNGIETAADVTDTANVTAAGALMDSEVDADIKTFVLPANTTISAFGASLIDDAAASNARTTLDVDQAGTDNSTVAIILAIGDETTDIATGTAKTTFRMPFAMTLTEVRASVTTAPTGSVATFDINESGTTILSTKLTIDAGEKTSETAATAAVISDSSLADDAEITIDIDAIGSTVAGAGPKIQLIGTKT